MNQLNQKIANMLNEIAELLEIKGEGLPFKPKAYRKASLAIENLSEDIALIYKQNGLIGLEKISGVGKSIAQKIEDFFKKGESKYLKELEKETAIRQIITYYFYSKGLDLKQLKENAKKRTIVYSRYTRPAKQLLELAGSMEKAKSAIDTVAQWANSRGLDYVIETVFKKWLELDRLKPKEIVKKPFYEENPMVWSEAKKKWYVISPEGEWLEFADKEEKIEWRITK